VIKYIAFATLFFLSGFLAPAKAQTEDEPYHNELIYGVNLNSNGGLLGGAFVRSAYTINENWLWLVGLEVVEVKHPKEYRLYSYTGDSFIRGKQNSLFVIRPHYGRELTLFRKAAESGVQVNAVGAIGPSLGLLAPYYIRYEHNTVNGGIPQVRTEQYDPVLHPEEKYIEGSAGVLTGIGESKLNLGIHTKAGLSFEYGRYNESITGVEVGFMLEAYPKKIIIIPEANNRQIFTSVYLNIYYGRRK
jgi:hypothetical protein